MKVEFFRLLDDHTWDTFIEALPPVADEIAKGSDMLAGYDNWESVPDDIFDEWVDQFIHEDLITQRQHRQARLIGVYSKLAEEEPHEAT